MVSKLRRVCGVLCVVLAACHDGTPPSATSAAVAAPPPSGPFDAALLAPTHATPRVLLPGAVTSVDRNGAARFVFTHDAAPSAAELAITPALRARGATTPAAVAALWHATRNAARWQLDADALGTAYVARVHDLGHGAIVVQLRQRVGGAEVAHTSLSLVLDRNLDLIALAGGLHPAARPTPALLHRTPALSPADAIARAFADVGVAQPALAAIADHAGWHRLDAAALPMPARVREVLYPVGDALVPAWETEIAARGAHRKVTGTHHVFAADDGRLLSRGSLTADDFAGFTYRVWADATGDLRPEDGPQGDFTPHPTGVPDGFVPAFVAPNDITIDGFNHAPGGGHDPWLDPAATTLTGNAVEEYADRDAIDGLSAGDIQATLTGSDAFQRTFDNTQSPVATADQSMAAITEQFYITNWLHDYWYDSGFTEAAGNAQTSNFGRGGVGGDVMHAEGQDASDFDNSDMTTPSDGESPRMQMYLFHAPPGDPLRDGTIDNQVIEHEWMHYMHHRLVTTCDQNECAGMSEGWADFDAMLTGARATDNLNGTYGMGGYVSLEFTPDAAYFGIRRYPYSTDFTKSPLTLRFVQSGVALPAGIPNDAAVAGDNYEVHSIGEIWCAMLWQGLVAELDESSGASPRFTFEQARRQFSEYVVGGMEAAPPEPTFTEQRDAILAVVAASDAIDFPLLANAFATRGFGTGAVSPAISSSNGNGVHEDFTVSGALSVESAAISEAEPSCDDDGILDVGETGNVTVVVRNVGAAALVNPTVSISSLTPGLITSGSASAQLGTLAPLATASVTLQVLLQEQSVDPSEVAVAISVDDASAAIAHVDGLASAPANLDVLASSAASDEFQEPALVWSVSSGWARRVTSDTQTQTVGVSVAADGDHQLVSPALDVATGADLVVAIAQRYELPLGDDGGVLEISSDGVNFVDVSTIAGAQPRYDATIAGAGNVLAGRSAWTGTSAGFPAFEAVTIDLGTGFAGQTVVLRFRAGGDDVARSAAWDIDSVAITGITNTPFPTLVPETSDCLPGHRPVANAGGTITLASGTQGALDGSLSSDADGDTLTFAWQQLSGFEIQLSSLTDAQPTFTAPVTAVDRFSVFQLIVTDSTNRPSVPASVTIHTLGAGGPVDAGVADAPSPHADAAVGHDATDDRPDAASPPMDADLPALQGGGGGCAAGGTSGGGYALVLLGAALLRRRRR